MQNYNIINLCADIESLIEKAAPEFNDMVILGDFNARNTEFLTNDITIMEGLYATCNRIGLREICKNLPVLWVTVPHVLAYYLSTTVIW